MKAVEENKMKLFHIPVNKFIRECSAEDIFEGEGGMKEKNSKKIGN